MIRLEFDGKCKKCYHADLKLIECGMETIHSSKTLWSVRCIHDDVAVEMREMERQRQLTIEELKAQIEELKLKIAELRGERQGLMYALKCKGVNIDE